MLLVIISKSKETLVRVDKFDDLVDKCVKITSIKCGSLNVKNSITKVGQPVYSIHFLVFPNSGIFTPLSKYNPTDVTT